MKAYSLLYFTLLSIMFGNLCFGNKNIPDYPVYSGDDLGLTYSPQKSVFKIWSPIAEEVKLNIYKDGTGKSFESEYKLKPAENGVWQIEIAGDLNSKFYTFQVKTEGKWLEETQGTYTKSVGANGLRAAIIDLKKTNPVNWEKDKKPVLNSFRDIVLYELHIRDFSIDQSSGMTSKGKFVSFTEKNTSNGKGEKTGIEHLKELGVTHVHLLPSFDFADIDETKPEVPQYNWGYGPVNYNVPEGSFSTDASKPQLRINEFKRMVMALHEAGIRVVMDVVYNHVFNVKTTPFSREVPGYYFRQNADGSLSDATQCGNETASERAMFRKYMVESVKFWAKEYHVDGFRFDLMAVHDIETMNLISDELYKMDPTIFMYGEGWTAGSSPLDESLRAAKSTTYKLNRIAVFSDELRDAIKGPWQVELEKQPGFVSGMKNQEESIKFGITAAVQHPQVNYGKVNYSKAPWAKEPYQFISYESCHDNLTVWDKLVIANPNAKKDELVRMNKLAATIVFMSQGTPFIHAGEEFLRSKGGMHNSYNLPDSVNRIDWMLKSQNKDVFNYYKTLISIRKTQPLFRLASQEAIASQLKFLEIKNENIVGFTLEGGTQAGSWKKVVVVLNGNLNAVNIELPAGRWKIIAKDGKIDANGLGSFNGGNTAVEATSSFILVQE